MRKITLLLLWLATAIGALAAPLLKAGDRLVFLGDSITEQRLYTRYVMNYFALRYPGIDISFRNAGWGGDYAPGGLARLGRDVLSLKPTVVSICYGMNDGGSRAFDQGYYDRSMAGFTGLITELQKAGVRVVLLTPGCVDIDRNPRLKGADWNYNDTLGKWRDGLRALAEREHLPFYDLHALMLDVQTRAKQDDATFTMIPDSVHPQAAGHTVMAYALLKALGCDAPASGLEIDIKTGTVRADRCTVTNLTREPAIISFTRHDDALPMWFDLDAARVARYLPLQQELNRYLFTITNLPAGAWKLAVDGMDVGVFTHEALAAGVNLGALPGPWLRLGEKVNALSLEQENLYFTRWRVIALASLPAEAAQEQQTLVEKLDSVISLREQARQLAASGQTWVWTLTKQP